MIAKELIAVNSLAIIMVSFIGKEKWLRYLVEKGDIILQDSEI